MTLELFEDLLAYIIFPIVIMFSFKKGEEKWKMILAIFMYFALIKYLKG